MKQLAKIILLFIALLFGQEIKADYVGQTFEYTYNGQTLNYSITSTSPRTVEVYSCSTSASGSLTIPSSVSYSSNTYSVTGIDHSAFSSCKSLTSISIPSTVTEIEYKAFYNCEGLTSISIPYNVVNIGDYAFEGCKGLTSVSFSGTNITKFNYRLFYNCENLVTITIPSSVTSIGSYVFYNCKSLTKFPSGGSGLKDIGDYAFSKCENLQTVNLPNNVTSIGEYVFYECQSLTSFSGGNSLEVIGYSCFNNNLSLSTVTLPSTIKSINTNAFYNCTSLSSITGLSNVEYLGLSAFYNTPWYNALPDGPIYIGKTLYRYKGTMPEGTTLNIKDNTKCITYSALQSQSGLVAVTIPSTVNSIGTNVFIYCPNLTSITVATGNSTYDSRNNCNAVIHKETNTLVAGCTATIIPNTVTAIGYYAMAGCNMTSLTIPDNVDSIANGAFASCKKLKSLTIGKGLRVIVSYPFDYCFNLQDIIVSTSNPYFDSRNNCKGIIEKSTNTLRLACSKTVIPQNVKAIGSYAYSTLESGTVATLTIPDQIETIKSSAFAWAPLKSVTIGKNVKEIGSSSFNCSSLRSIHSLVDFPSEINTSSFPSTVYENATLYVPIGSIANYRATEGWNKFQNIVEEQPGTLYVDDVVEDSSVEGVQLYFKVTSTTDKTCEVIGCATGVTGTVTIPSSVNGMSVTSIGYEAFKESGYQHEINNVVVPNSITNIGDYAFYYCDTLLSVSLPSTLKSIGYYAFYNCEELPITSLPNGLETIGQWAFAGCKGSTSLTIPATVTSIGKAAFCGWKDMATITVDNGNTVYSSPIGSNAIIENATHTLVQGCKNTVIPNNIETIGYGAFNSHEGLTSIVIPNSVSIIESYAFNNTGLTSINIPASVRSINDYAFRYCDNLTSIISEIKTPLGFSDNVFQHRSDVADPYEAATLYVPYGTKSWYQETDGWKNFQHIVEQEGGQIKGDVNNDKLVDGVDLVALVNIILEKMAKTTGADVNNDGKVNGVDFVALVNLVLNRSASRMKEQADTGTADVYIEPFSIEAGNSCDMLIGLNNADADVTLMQFDLHLPSGLKLKTDNDGFVMDMADRTNWRTHSLNANATNGIVRFLLSSTSNALIDGSEGAVLRLALEADENFQGGVIELRDVLSVSPSMQQWRTPVYRYVIGSGAMSGVNSQTAPQYNETEVNSLSGQRRQAPKKGVNVIGGKKVIVK